MSITKSKNKNTLKGKCSKKQIAIEEFQGGKDTFSFFKNWETDTRQREK